jgi:CRISPR-associated protein Cmr5
MSRQRSLEQERAKAVWDNVVFVKGKSYAKEYGGLAKSAPADIQANGLGQTLAFWRAKGYKDGQPKENDAHAELLKHASDWLRSQKILPEGKDVVEWIAKGASTNDYRRATSEVIAFLSWLKRFAEADLPKGE